VTDGTRAFYEHRAAEYAATTSKVDLQHLYSVFERHVTKGSRVLDVGCGSGRDIVALSQRGFHVDGLDYSAPMASIATERTGKHVVVSAIEDLRAVHEYDAVWAVASLLHVQRNRIGSALKAIATSLYPRGYLLTSMQLGFGSETARDGRRFELYTVHEWDLLLKQAGFSVAETILTRTLSARAESINWMAHICLLQE
jgi:2-polyprenyl-3-methyl-5-hydroxy-6-metoxy-1,4-benzoquinol methylase